jgi:nucleotide-binding universal stress UspA family protein
LRGALLVAVHACETPTRVAAYAPVHPPETTTEERRQEEESHLTEVVAEALGPVRSRAVQQVCEPTTPVRALLAHATGASLLVLATSADLAGGTGVGATALACVRHAPCPVVVLPDESGS